MPIVTKSFEGVRAGEVYPVVIEAGEECPSELLDAAIALGCVDVALDQGAGEAGATDEGEPDDTAEQSPKRTRRAAV